MNHIRFEAKARELTSSGSAVSVAARTLVVSVDVDRLIRPWLAGQEAVGLVFNRHKRIGEIEPTFDLSMELPLDLALEVGERLVEAVRRFKARRAERA